MVSLRSHLALAWIVAIISGFGGQLFASESNSDLSAWINAQTNLQTWTATVLQTRTLKALTEPLTATGRVWFAAPNRFRWELGDPPKTIAVRQSDQMLVIYPRLKRVERYPLTGDGTGPWRDALALLDVGFPRSGSDLESRYRVAVAAATNGVRELTLQPRSASARRLMPQIRISFATNDFSLRATELQFADGSTMRNEFKNAVLNPKLEETLFSPKLEPDFQSVEPLAKQASRNRPQN